MKKKKAADRAKQRTIRAADRFWKTIEDAAEAKGFSVSTFVVDAAYERAREVLRDFKEGEK